MTRHLWCIKSPHGALVPGDVSLNRSTAIAEFTRRKNTGPVVTRYRNDGTTYQEPNHYQSWKALYREGWRVVPVELCELPQTRNTPIGVCAGENLLQYNSSVNPLLRKTTIKNWRIGALVFATKRKGELYCRIGR